MIPINRPLYNGPSIGSLGALARVLGVSSIEELSDVADNAHRFYRPGKTVEKNGKKRKTIKTIGKLRLIQGRIKGRLLSRLKFPRYLQGGVKDLEFPRDHVRNAALHAGSRLVITQDVRKFYPSVEPDHIKMIWQHFFNFHPDVAQCLTKLTTYNNQLPQGTVTSNYLANLVFYDLEPELVSKLSELSVRYSRYIDDITMSSDNFLDKGLQTLAICEVVGMMSKWGLRPKREKHQIMSAAGRMQIHGLNVNRSSPTMNRKDRSSIRNQVHKLELLAQVDRTDPNFEKFFTSMGGIVSCLKRLHPDEADALRQRLVPIRPLPSDKKIAELRKQVSYCRNTPIRDRAGRGFSRRLNRISSAVGMIRHARPNEANQLLTQLAAVRRNII